MTIRTPSTRAVLSAALLMLSATASVATTLPDGFVDETIGADWSEPAGLTFDPLGKLFVWERGGRLWTVSNNVKSAAPVIDISAEVGAWTDHGLIGVALDPTYLSNGHIYFNYTVDRHHLLNCSEPPSGVGAPLCGAAYDVNTNQYSSATIARLARYTLIKPVGDADFRNATSVDYASRKVLAGASAGTGCPVLEQSHSAGALQFASDGTLIVGCGDGANGGPLDAGSGFGTYWQQAIADGIIPSAHNLGSYRAQILSSMNGKLFRIDPATGLGVASNPFFDPADPGSVQSRVWALGMRNPFRFYILPGSGSHNVADGDVGVILLGDVGRHRWEEINVIDGPGQNLGWPVFEGLKPADEYEDAPRGHPDAPNPLFGTAGCDEPADAFFRFRDLLIQETLQPLPDWPNPCDPLQGVATGVPLFEHKRPLIAIHHKPWGRTEWPAFDGVDAIHPQLNSAAPDGSAVLGNYFQANATAGGVLYTGGNFPSYYDGAFFYADYVGEWIKILRLDENLALQRAPAVALEDFASDAGPVVAITQHPVDGTLYYIDFATSVKRISYIGDGNTAPRARMEANVAYGPSPLTVAFSSARSDDGDGDALSFLWDFGDNTTSTQPHPVHVFDPQSQITEPTAFNVSLTVTDAPGLARSASTIVAVNNTPPTVTIDSPADATLYALSGNNPYTLSATIGDAEQDPLTLQCSWRLVLHHNTHTHGDPPLTSCAGAITVAPTGCGSETYFYRVLLSVSDAQGLTSDAEVALFPDCGAGFTAPLAGDDMVNVTIGQSVSIDVLSNDSDDTQLTPGSVTIISPPSRGDIVAQDANNGIITYQHGGGTATTDRFSYVVADNDGLASNVAHVSIAITSGPVDSDGDGVSDDQDNCTLAANPSQLDADNDGFGNRCDPDLNNDNIINVIDLGMLRQVFFSADPVADFNGDGVVNASDLGIMRLYFFLPPGPAAPP